MEALEECEDAEHVLIVIDHGEQGISWHCDTDRMSVKLGLSEFVSTCVRDTIAKLKEE
jgi:hypothetical protein